MMNPQSTISNYMKRSAFNCYYANQSINQLIDDVYKQHYNRLITELDYYYHTSDHYSLNACYFELTQLRLISFLLKPVLKERYFKLADDFLNRLQNRIQSIQRLDTFQSNIYFFLPNQIEASQINQLHHTIQLHANSNEVLFKRSIAKYLKSGQIDSIDPRKIKKAVRESSIPVKLLWRNILSKSLKQLNEQAIALMMANQSNRTTIVNKIQKHSLRLIFYLNHISVFQSLGEDQFQEDLFLLIEKSNQFLYSEKYITLLQTIRRVYYTNSEDEKVINQIIGNVLLQQKEKFNQVYDNASILFLSNEWMHINSNLLSHINDVNQTLSFTSSIVGQVYAGSLS